MALCPSCKKKIAYRAYFRSGASFLCNHCRQVITKKISNEASLVLIGIVAGLLAGYCALFFRIKFTDFKPGDIIASFHITLGAAILAALIAGRMIWDRWIEL